MQTVPVPVWVPTAGLNPKCKLIHEIIVSLSTFKKNTLNISNVTYYYY